MLRSEKHLKWYEKCNCQTEMKLGLRLWSYVREEASHGRKAPIDPFTRESIKPSASQGVPLGGMGTGSI